MATDPAPVFTLPDLGEGLLEAEVVAWHVAEGDHVVADQPLVSVETDKAVVEIPSPRSGRIARILAPLHATIAVGAPLVTFESGPEQDTGTVVGDLAAPPPSPVTRAAPTPRARAAPAIRALATSLGVDLATLTGTGPDGSVTRADVQRAAETAGQTDGQADGQAGGAGMEPLRGVRRAMAMRMAAAGAVVVPATVTDEVDVDEWPSGTSVTARLIVAMVVACQAEPALNATYDGKTVARRVNTNVNVGVAVDTEDGLLVPILQNAECSDLAGITGQLESLEAAARSRRITPEALRGATITLSNFGAIGGQFAALVVVPPQVAILGAGRIVPRIVTHGDGFAARRMLPLSLTFDHRAVSGGEAARFLATIKANLERGA